MENLSAEFFANYSLALFHTQSWKDAEEICARGLKIYPRNKSIIGNLTFAHIQLGQIADALRTAETRLSISRDVHSLEITALAVKSCADKIANRDWKTAASYYARAVSLLDEAKQRNPRYASARCNRAQILLKLKDYENASNEFRNLIESCKQGSPITFICLGGYAEILRQLGELEKCVDFCKEWLPVVDTSPFLRRVLAMALTEFYVEKDGEKIVVKEALLFFEGSVEEHDGSWIEDFCYLADLYARMGRFSESYNLLVAAEQRFPGHWMQQHYRALIQSYENHFGDALKSLKEAIERAPFQSEPWWLVAQIQHRLGVNTEAETARRNSKKVADEHRRLAQEALQSIGR
jgi:tetratricopeptide (TPR) repeat protein